MSPRRRRSRPPAADPSRGGGRRGAAQNRQQTEERIESVAKGLSVYLGLLLTIVFTFVGFVYLVFIARNIFFVSLLFAITSYAVTKSIYYRWGHSKSRSYFFGSMLAFALYFVTLMFGLLGGAVEMFGPNPPAIVFIAGLYYLVRASTGLLDDIAHLAGHSGVGAGPKLIVGGIMVIVSGFIIFQFILGGSWAAAGDLVGGAGYGVEQAFGNVATVAGTGWERFTTSLSPSNNPNVARIACTFEAGFGGGMNPQQGAGSVAIQACVREKLGQNRSTAESEQVTEPVEVQVEEVQVEPFPDHLRVVLPVTNTLVYDLQGRTINITAQDVNVTARVKYLGSQVAKASRDDMRIPNGDTRTIEFNRLEDGSGYVFPLFRYVTDDFQPTSTIQRNFETIKNDCNNDGWADESNSCKNAVKYFLSGQGSFPGSFEFRDERFTRERIAFLVKSTDNFEMDGLHYVNNNKFGIVDLNDQNLIAAGNEYDIEVDASYTYSAEAAFTESSRWRSGNLLLKVWNPDAWNELSFDERQSWESQNCGTVERFNQEFTKQRTAALTTPIVPVMYADCSSTLFRLIDDENGDGIYDGDIEISVGASVQGDSVDQEFPIEITGATTTCGNDNSNDLTDGNDVQKAIPDRLTHQAGAGWAVDPGIVTRTVEVAGESQSIGCSVEMTFRLTVDRTETYEVPAFDYEQ